MIDGRKWVQQPFPYQAKCLGWLRQSYGELSDQALTQVDAVLADTGLSELFV